MTINSKYRGNNLENNRFATQPNQNRSEEKLGDSYPEVDSRRNNLSRLALASDRSWL
jgi:hypothetical protein